MGEELIKPAAIDMVRQMCGKEQAAKLASVPLSNDTVQRRIMDMSLDVKEQVIKKIKDKDSGDFSLQLDETTDVAKCAQLLTYVRISGPDDLEEHFLFCKPLETTTKGIDIFNLVDSFFMDHGIEWANCFSIYVGKSEGLCYRSKEEESYHYDCALFASSRKLSEPEVKW